MKKNYNTKSPNSYEIQLVFLLSILYTQKTLNYHLVSMQNCSKFNVYVYATDFSAGYNTIDSRKTPKHKRYLRKGSNGTPGPSSS